MKFDKPTFEREHLIAREGGKGIQKIWKFRNGYGASVVRFEIANCFGRKEKIGSYGVNEGLWELAVIKFKPDDKTEKGKPSFLLVYDTGITNDVMGYLTKEKIVEILKKIKVLK